VIDRSLGGTGGSWFFSARRSYFDQLLRPVANFPYHLTDLQARATIPTRGGGYLSITSYWGDDVLDLSDFEGSDPDDSDDILRVSWQWGNRVLGVNWRQPLGQWSADVRLGFSGFRDELGFIDFGDVRLASRIEQSVAHAVLRREFTPALSLSLGLGADRIHHRNRAEAGGTSFFASDGDGLLGNSFVSLRWQLGSRWVAEPGLRLEAWRPDADGRTFLAPRFALKRFLGDGEQAAFKLAVGRYHQFVHSLRDQELPISNDTWVLADDAVPPVVSDQAQVGIETFWGSWQASAEAYVRSFRGVTEFNLSEDPNDVADDLLAGEGSSYGLDLLLRRATGRLTGWATLSLLRAERTFPDPLAAGWEDLPQQVTFPPIFDRRVNFDLVAQYIASNRFEFGLRWNYGSGLPYTRPLAQYFAWRHHPLYGRSEPLDIGFERDGIPVTVALGPRNRERYPAYHRLDLTIRRTFQRSWGSYVPYLQILNVYNRRNVLFYFFDYDRTPPVRSGFSMFPILPAIGLEVVF
jgi:hypothetical protein